MKYLVILLIFLGLAGWVGFRYRRQLTMAWQVWKMLRGAHASIKQQKQATAAPQPKHIPGEQLVRCEKCNTWTAKDTAISFGPKTYFCSAKCMETSAAN